MIRTTDRSVDVAIMRHVKSRRDYPRDWFLRAAAVNPTTRNDDSRQIDATVATETPVLTYDRRTDTLVREVLVADGAILPTWTPFLEQHERWSLLTLGSAVDYRRRGRTLTATLRFADDEHVERIWRRVRDDHLRGVSIGGARLAWTDIEPRNSATVAGRRWTAGSETLRITHRWRPAESSLVLFAADERATVATRTP